MRQFKIQKIHAAEMYRSNATSQGNTITRLIIKSNDSIALVREVAFELHLLWFEFNHRGYSVFTLERCWPSWERRRKSTLMWHREWNPSFVWARVNLNNVVKHLMGFNQVLIGVNTLFKFTCAGTKLGLLSSGMSHRCGLGWVPSDVGHRPTYFVSIHLSPTPKSCK